MLVNHWDKYTEMHGQQNVKIKFYVEIYNYRIMYFNIQALCVPLAVVSCLNLLLYWNKYAIGDSFVILLVFLFLLRCWEGKFLKF